jgi:hypothetical protein|uniref:Uncharacterized protein n=1 Tax=Arabidopsis thaliana TaxID=3702 RepID=Q0WNI0_ARATH|nr:hypothetical protein [Arabidopsis thaliana]
METLGLNLHEINTKLAGFVIKHDLFYLKETKLLAGHANLVDCEGSKERLVQKREINDRKCSLAGA